jgi:hypothetical protein
MEENNGEEIGGCLGELDPLAVPISNISLLPSTCVRLPPLVDACVAGSKLMPSCRREPAQVCVCVSIGGSEHLGR